MERTRDGTLQLLLKLIMRVVISTDPQLKSQQYVSLTTMTSPKGSHAGNIHYFALRNDRIAGHIITKR